MQAAIPVIPADLMAAPKAAGSSTAVASIAGSESSFKNQLTTASQGQQQTDLGQPGQADISIVISAATEETKADMTSQLLFAAEIAAGRMTLEVQPFQQNASSIDRLMAINTLQEIITEQNPNAGHAAILQVLDAITAQVPGKTILERGLAAEQQQTGLNILPSETSGQPQIQIQLSAQPVQQAESTSPQGKTNGQPQIQLSTQPVQQAESISPQGKTNESWSATFSSLHGIQSNSAAGQNAAPTPQQGFYPVSGQENTSQLITVYQSSGMEELAVSMKPASTGANTELAGVRLDVNGNFIHSHLPDEVAKIAGNTSEPEQQAGKGSKQSQGNIPMQAEQLQNETTAPAKETPLIFSLNQGEASVSNSSQPTTATSLTLRLPSGLEVPESRILDQVINRFTLNRRLESGSITLRLHPQELGELRMEIKVEQDNIKAHITTQNPQVQEILDRHLPRLREALEQQGLSLEQMKVTVADSDNTDAQLFQENTGQQQLNRSTGTQSNHTSFSLPLEEETETVDAQPKILNVLI
ncbi:MAG: hypothetical protein GQ559_09540 [Desulfobulbaceae bacterium]|nr:hypothetical protein [Desulfobulbaceae bacterium]